MYGFRSIFGSATRSLQSGGGIGDIYSGGLDPNQEGGAVQTRRMYNADDMDQEEPGVLDGPPVSDDVEDHIMAGPSTSGASVGRRRPPIPLAPVRGSRVYRPNTHLQRTMRALKLVKNLREGKLTSVHGRLLGWKMHGSEGGEKRKGRLPRILRQAAVYGALNWKMGYKNLTLTPSANLTRKYQNAIQELGDHEGNVGTVSDVVQALARRTKRKNRATNKKKGRKKKKKKKRRPAAPDGQVGEGGQVGGLLLPMMAKLFLASAGRG